MADWSPVGGRTRYVVAKMQCEWTVRAEQQTCVTIPLQKLQKLEGLPKSERVMSLGVGWALPR